ncbi:hypothetical protein D210916BOD24_17370 [Alteromonas sp. D210916BOD_24]|uniref:hypothetical protein n=1 Tax=Alteromonas sp. D210916BOD_24 TaxID=3157618 RepID=UPI00399CA86F
MLRHISILIALIFSMNLYAINCVPLEPKGGQDIDLDTKGSIDGKIKGAMSKIVGLEVDIDGAYSLVRRETLKEYPDANQLYIWERLLFLNCEVINESEMTDSQKLSRFDVLLEKMSFGLPNLKAKSTTEYKNVLADIRTSLYRKDELLFPAMESFLNNRTEANWAAVVRQAKEDSEKIRAGIQRSMLYDASIENNAQEIRSSLNGMDTAISKKYYREFKETRKKWNEKLRKYESIQTITTKNIPSDEQVHEWLNNLKVMYSLLETELDKVINNHVSS